MKNPYAQTCIGLLLATISLGTLAQAQSLTPSPGWTRAMPSGPDARVKITEEYAKQVGRDAYFWAWDRGRPPGRPRNWRPWSIRQLLLFNMGMAGRCCVFGSSSLPLRICAWPG